MNKMDLVKIVANRLREERYRKNIPIPKDVLKIVDSEGNEKNIYLKRKDRLVYLTIEDVKAVMDIMLEEILVCLQNGDVFSIPGYGILRLQYRKPKTIKDPNDPNIKYDIFDDYYPKLVPQKALVEAGKIYTIKRRENKELEDFYRANEVEYDPFLDLDGDEDGDEE